MDTDPLPTSPLLGLITLAVKAIEFNPPASWGAWTLIIAIAFLCLMCSAFVSGSEIAYFGLSPADVDTLRDEDAPESGKKAIRLLEDSEGLLATILICNNMVNVTLVILLAFAIEQTVTFNDVVVAFLLQTVFLTFLLLLFGEILPKLVAKSKRMQWVLATSSVLTALYKLCRPLSRFMAHFSSIVNRLVTKKRPNISADELETALEISDVSEGKDKEMLEGILSFGDKQVSDVMTSRVDITDIEYHDSWQEVLRVAVESGYSRIPVYDTSQDAIRGILYSKDLLPYISAEEETVEWQKLIREPYFVPESRMIDDLLEDFRLRKIHIAVVIDEYGGTQGIVTLEDILEEIVGEIDDEYDEDETLYKKLAPDMYSFDAKIPVVDFCRTVGIDEEELGDPGEQAETLAGLLLEIKGDFPELNEVIDWGRFRFKVLDMERHRIRKVKVLMQPSAGGNKDD